MCQKIAISDEIQYFRYIQYTDLVYTQDYEEFEHDGKTYVNLNGQHLYRTSDGDLSFTETQGSTKLSTWVYTTIQNADQADYVAYNTSIGCNGASQQCATNAGTDWGSWNWEGYNPVNASANDPALRVFNANEMEAATDYINRQLEAGNVVIVGVDSDAYQTAEAASGVDNLYGTDHFVVITGRMVNSSGNNVFTFYENATANTTTGTDTDNQISPGNNYFYNSPNWYGTTGNVTWVKINGN